MKVYITESWLRERFGLAQQTEVQVPANAVFTPSARELLESRKVTVKYVDEQGQTFREQGVHQQAEAVAPDLVKVHALTSESHHQSANCLLCQQIVQKKPDTLTHLNAHELVSKSDGRIQLRSLVDGAIAFAVWIQAEQYGQWSAVFDLWLADIRSALGNLMRADATGTPMPPVSMGEFDSEALHQLSHHPLRFIGYDHIVPDVQYGLTVARLNMLRAKIREAETIAAQVLITHDFKVLRPDMMQGLNRLSSAVYVLMIFCIVIEKQKVDPNQIWQVAAQRLRGVTA